MPKTYLPFLFSYERQLIKKLKIKKPGKPLIAIGGFAGSGKDTFARLLQKNLKEKCKLALELHQAGTIFRAAAAEAGYGPRRLDEFSAIAGARLDELIERQILKTALTKGGIVVGRLAPATVGDWGIKIFFKAAPELIAARIVADKSRHEYGMPLAELTARIVHRDKEDCERLEKLYKIKFTELLSKFDLIVENSGPIADTAAAVFSYVRGLLKAQGYL